MSQEHQVKLPAHRTRGKPVVSQVHQVKLPAHRTRGKPVVSQVHQVKLPAHRTRGKPVVSQEHQVKLPARAQKCPRGQMLEGQEFSCGLGRHIDHISGTSVFLFGQPATDRKRNVISCAMCWQLDLMFLAQNWLVSCAMCWQLDADLFIPYRWKIVYSDSKGVRLTFKCVEHFRSSVLCIIPFDLGTVRHISSRLPAQSSFHECC